MGRLGARDPRSHRKGRDVSDEEFKLPVEVVAAAVTELSTTTGTDDGMALPPMGRTDSMGRRYLTKLGANVISTLSGIATQVVVVRGLGPAAYGDYSFLTNFFTQVTDFFDVGSIGFYTKLSARPRDQGLVRFYWNFMLASGVLLVGGTLAVAFSRYREQLWPGQHLRFIILALGFAWLTWFVKIAGQVADALGLTVPADAYRAVQRVLGAVALVAFGAAGLVTLTFYFGYQYVAFAGLLIAWSVILRRNGYRLSGRAPTESGANREYARELGSYAMPLLVLAIVHLVGGILSRWLLQRYGGSTEQGYFGLSNQLGAMCFLLTSSLSPVWMRDMSVAYAANDVGAERRLFVQAVPTLYAFAAYVGVFLALQGGRFASLFGGHAYQAAGLTVSLMALYPLHQTYGQLSGSMLLVHGRTKLYRNIGIANSILGLPLLLWLLMPQSRGGLNLGAVGLAIVTLVSQFIGVNAQLWFNAADIGLPFGKLLRDQFLTIGSFGVIGVASVALGSIARLDGLTNILVSGVAYTILTALVLLRAPAMFGLTRNIVAQVATRVRGLAARLRKPRK